MSKDGRWFTLLFLLSIFLITHSNPSTQIPFWIALMPCAILQNTKFVFRWSKSVVDQSFLESYCRCPYRKLTETHVAIASVASYCLTVACGYWRGCNDYRSVAVPPLLSGLESQKMESWKGSSGGRFTNAAVSGRWFGLSPHGLAGLRLMTSWLPPLLGKGICSRPNAPRFGYGDAFLITRVHLTCRAHNL